MLIERQHLANWFARLCCQMVTLLREQIDIRDYLLFRSSVQDKHRLRCPGVISVRHTESQKLSER